MITKDDYWLISITVLSSLAGALASKYIDLTFSNPVASMTSIFLLLIFVAVEVIVLKFLRDRFFH